MTGVFGHRARLLSLVAFAALTLLAGVQAGKSQTAEVEDETCLTCHDGYQNHLSNTAHRLSSTTNKPAAQIACASCHTGASDHIEEPSVDNITNPGTAVVETQLDICSQCHQPHHEMNQFGLDPHAGLNLACADCHSIHSGSVSLLIDDKADFCGKCHVSVVNDFLRRSNHPLTDGAVTCISCHNFRAELEPNFGHGAAANCFSCHPFQSGPHPFEHEATSSFSTEGGGCTTCHAPHGSPNERLLTQTGNNLCRQCHGIPPAHRTAHDGIGVRFNCMDCHTDIHGSDDNQALLDPNLGSELGDGPGTCWCHGADN